MNLKLTDKTALVSGSTKGIGFAIATGLAREGAQVIVNGVRRKGSRKPRSTPRYRVTDRHAGGEPSRGLHRPGQRATRSLPC
jgi:NAD(P)-dependent dehydrogenase (short-subunit alcohol dehydrogenase family)